MAQLLYLRRRNEYEEFSMEILQHVNGAGNLVGPRVTPQEPAAAPVIPATVMPAECEVSA
jgi:hypothetical protein